MLLEEPNDVRFSNRTTRGFKDLMAKFSEITSRHPEANQEKLCVNSALTSPGRRRENNQERFHGS